MSQNVTGNLGLNGRIQVPVELPSPRNMRVPSSLCYIECSCRFKRLARDCHRRSLPWMNAMPDVRQQPCVASSLPCAGWREFLLKLLGIRLQC